VYRDCYKKRQVCKALFLGRFDNFPLQELSAIKKRDLRPDSGGWQACACFVIDTALLVDHARLGGTSG
jgi:hypothetical protein